MESEKFAELNFQRWEVTFEIWRRLKLEIRRAVKKIAGSNHIKIEQLHLLDRSGETVWLPDVLKVVVTVKDFAQVQELRELFMGEISPRCSPFDCRHLA
ncbi:MAG: hypothetical protein ABIH35_03630 [Patescibacteria group bacterium]